MPVEPNLRPTQCARFSLLFLLCISITTACSSTQENPKKVAAAVPDPSVVKGDREAIARDFKREKRRSRIEERKQTQETPNFNKLELETLAFGSDQVPRVKKYYRDGRASGVLSRKEADLNADGRAEYIQIMDSSGQWVEKERADLNGDGRFEVTQFYKKDLGSKQRELVREEIDALFNDKVSVWKFYKDGQLKVRAIDRDEDGLADYWEYFEAGKLMRIDQDANGDGHPDSRNKFRKIANPKGPKPGFRAKK